MLFHGVDSWFDGLMVQTYGHILHYDCYSSHMLAVKVKTLH